MHDAHIKDLILSLSNTLSAATNDDFVLLRNIPAPVGTVVTVAREGNLDVILVFETNNVLATLANQRRVVLARNLQDFHCLVSLWIC